MQMYAIGFLHMKTRLHFLKEALLGFRTYKEFQEFLEMVNGLLATNFKNYGLFVLHFKLRIIIGHI